ncbi:putative Zinc finger MYM-type protein [Daphnia magna]|uniref:Putative Zinc finger MYM-type protein n=1 Tax=Daphnia magna TaxID=35525 RepID=A0A164HHN3_9CRUS|nr:putative Zinc finger MYM-type protein [Daphnia magna]
MGVKVLSLIISEIQEARFFSVSIDSTPDLTHVDQLSMIIRYVSVTSHEATERFLSFIPIESTGEYLTNIILKYFQDQKIDIKNARGQSHDNAANMSGSKVAGLFGFINVSWRLDFDILIEKATILQTQYSSYLEKLFPNELTHFSLYIKQYLETESPDFEKSFTVNMMYQTLFTQKVQLTFLNVEIALRIFLSLMVSVVSGERSFSKLKLIKNEKRTTMGQNRLNFLSLMSTESEFIKCLSFDDLIEQFVKEKIRKVQV